MASAILEKLDQALGQIDRPGSFCVSGSVPAVLPGLEVEGLGPVGLPLTPEAGEGADQALPSGPLRQGRADPRRHEASGASGGWSRTASR